MLGGDVKPFDYQDGHWYTQGGGGSQSVWTKDGKVTDPWTATDTSSVGGAGTGGGGVPGDATVKASNEGAQYTKAITGDITWNAGIGTLTVVPQYSKTTSDNSNSYEGNDGNTYTAFLNMEQTQKGVELRMTSASDFFFSWILGGNYYKNNNFQENWSDNTSTVYGFMDFMEKDSAVFANITYPISDRFRGTGGYRLSWSEGNRTQTNPESGAIDAGEPSKISAHPDYKLGVEYDVADNSMAYATYATSYRANPMGMGQMTDQTTEQLKSYTVGAKNRFLGNKVQLNVAAYYYDYENKSATMNSDGRMNFGDLSYDVYEDDLADADGNLIDVNKNGISGEHALLTDFYNDPMGGSAGKFRTIGADISAQWAITSKDRLNLGVSYLNAKWAKLKYAWYWHWAEGNSVGEEAGNSFWESDGKDYSGYTNTYSPTWTITSSYEHIFELGSYGMLTPHVDIQYKSEYFLDYVNQIITYQEAFYTVDGSVTFNPASGKWSLNGYVKNATNYAAKDFFISMGTSSLGVSDPRTYGTVLSVKF
jgi:iron complex outermembrane recepter protein